MLMSSMKIWIELVLRICLNDQFRMSLSLKSCNIVNINSEDKDEIEKLKSSKRVMK